MLTVACVLWAGEFKGRASLPEHVLRLRDQVKAHLSMPHRFVCLSNMDIDGVEVEPLVTDWPGWWAKLELFRPGLFGGRVLYLDLDVTVCGGLDDIPNFRAPFAAIRDWERPGYNSSVMTWDADCAEVRGVHGGFAELDPGERPAGGDQAWLSKIVAGAYLPPEWCRSYKHECRYSVPKGTRVVVWHGKPKPWDFKGSLIIDGQPVAA